MMSGFSSKLLVLSSYLEVVKRVLRRKPYLSYGRQPFFAKFWTDAANSIGADIDSLGDDIFRISKAKNSTLVQFHYVNIDTYFNWMMVAQKPFVCKLLSDQGYPIARYLEYNIRDISKARQFIDEISGNFVVKPISGAGGGGITTGITDQKKLKRASVIAAANFSKKLMPVSLFSLMSFPFGGTTSVSSYPCWRRTGQSAGDSCPQSPKKEMT